MSETIEKAALLDNIQEGYKEFEALLAPLSEEQMTVPGVSGRWSVKDTIAHIAAWHGYLWITCRVCWLVILMSIMRSMAILLGIG